MTSTAELSAASVMNDESEVNEARATITKLATNAAEETTAAEMVHAASPWQHHAHSHATVPETPAAPAQKMHAEATHAVSATQRK